MAKVEKYVVLDVDLPFYADDNAPNGTWLSDAKDGLGNPIQKKLTKGTKLVILDPAKVPTTQEAASHIPLWQCLDGKGYFNDNGYCRCWLYQEDPLANGNHGVPVVIGKDAWGELSHMIEVDSTPPPQPPPPPSPVEEGWLVVTALKIEFSPFRLLIATKKPE